MRLAAWCETCKRLDNRVRRNAKPRKWRRQTPEERRASQRKIYANETKAQRKRRREANLMAYYLRQERKTGKLPQRRVKVKEKNEGRDLVDVAPLVEFIKVHLDMSQKTPSEFAEYLDIDSSHMYKWLNGEKKRVELAFADRIIMRLGGILHEVYPDADAT